MSRSVGIVLIALGALGAAAPAAAGRAHLDVQLFAHVPPPGYPADIARAPDGRIWVGSYVPVVGNYDGPSKIFAFDPSGSLRASYAVKGQDTSTRHGVNGFAFDARGRLYFATQNLDDHGKPSRLWRLDPRTGAQTSYGLLPDVPPCSAGRQTKCSASSADDAPHPDFAEFGADGSLYVADFQQALIWRVPPGGGTGQVWLTDKRLDGGVYATSGVRFTVDGRSLLVSTMTGGPNTGPFPSTAPGAIYRVPVRSGGRAGPMQLFWRSGPYDGPDGFAVARSGNVYVALALNNQFAELSPAGNEIARIPATPAPAPAVNPMLPAPFDTPSGVIFDGRRLLVTNIATSSGLPSNMVVFDIWAGEEGLRPHYPSDPAKRPARRRRARRSIRCAARRGGSGGNSGRGGGGGRCTSRR